MKKKLFLSGLLLLVILSSSMRIQSVIGDISAQVSGYYHEKTGGTLFLHTDKPVYIVNENIWFKAYILDSTPLQDEVLYLRLLNEQKQIVLQKQFPVYDIRSHGNMSIPVTMEPGRYRLVAYTDKMISFNPENVFVQQIQVIKDQSSELKAEASFTDSTDFSAGNKPAITIKVSADDHEIEKAKGTYRIYTSNKKTIEEGKFVTGPSGVATLHFIYPSTAGNEDVFLQFKVTDKEQSKELNIRLPKTATSFSADCYPEGGHLVNGVSNRVLIAIKDGSGLPMAGSVALESERKVIVTTNARSNGLALITFTPDVKRKYSLRIRSAGNSRTIVFPVKIEPAGYVIQLKGTPDHPVIMLKNQNMQENVVLLGRTLSELKLQESLTVKRGDSVLVVLPKNDSLNHIIDLGLFSADKKLLAERLVYLPAPAKYRVAFRFDKVSYRSREKVRAEITVTDEKGKNVSSNLSVAVVAKQALSPTVQKRITDTDLNALRHARTNLTDINDLNNILIGEDIRTGNWVDVINYQAKGQVTIFSNAAGIFGQVINKRNKKIDLKTLYLYNKSEIVTVPVNSNGTFSIPAVNLITDSGEPNYLIVNKDLNDRYDVQIKDYSVDFDRLVMASLPESLPDYDLVRHSTYAAPLMSGRILREVVIKGKKSTLAAPENFDVTDYHSNNCSDYICFYNILNCKNHLGGLRPADGQIYVLNGRPIRYHGCESNKEPKKNAYLVKNIHSPQAFYLPDYAREPISSPELQSTIFWEPNVNTPLSGKTVVEFYTSDFKGAFTIVVQGLTVAGLVPVFGESDFKVAIN
jgi:hypothetical protein